MRVAPPSDATGRPGGRTGPPPELPPTIGGIGIAGVLALVAFLLDRPEAGFGLAAISLSHLLLVPLALRERWRPVARVGLVVGTFLTLLVVVGLTGGLHSPALWLVIALPIGGAQMSGMRLAITWMGLGMGLVGLVAGLDAADALPPSLIPTGLEAMAQAVAAVGLLGLVGTTAVTYHQERSRSYKALQQAVDELHEARMVAEEASRAKGDFLASMSHEIRTPMNGVLGMLELMMQDELSPEQRMRARGAAQAGRSLLQILNEVLDLSKIEAGRLEIEQVEMDLHELLEDVAALFRPAASGRPVELLLEIAAETPRWVKGDPLRLRQVLSNLLGNAVKFTERGSIRLRALPLEGAILRIEVIDTGVGFTPEQGARLFQAFSQAERSTSRRFGGTGLGLAISRRIIEAMSGNIGARSVPGEGSTFWFELPAPVVAAPPPAEPERPAPAAPVEARVLLADDNPMNQRVAGGMLKLLGCRTRVVCNGAEAVTAAREEHFDIILMDWQMPVLDGLEATRQIRAGPGSRVPIFAVTASSSEEERQTCMEAGVDGVLTKPLSIAALKQILEQQLGRAVA